MRKLFWSIALSSLLTANIASAQLITQDMYNLMRLAVARNADQAGFTKEDAESFLNVSLERQGRIYKSERTVPDFPDQASVEYSANKGNRYLSVYFTEPVKDFIYQLDHLRGYETSRFVSRQINNNIIYSFIGEPPSYSIKTRQLFIRVYECSDKPNDKCVRKAQLIFAEG